MCGQGRVWHALDHLLLARVHEAELLSVTLHTTPNPRAAHHIDPTFMMAGPLGRLEGEPAPTAVQLTTHVVGSCAYCGRQAIYRLPASHLLAIYPSGGNLTVAHFPQPSLVNTAHPSSYLSHLDNPVQVSLS